MVIDSASYLHAILKALLQYKSLKEGKARLLAALKYLEMLSKCLSDKREYKIGVTSDFAVRKIVQ